MMQTAKSSQKVIFKLPKLARAIGQGIGLSLLGLSIGLLPVKAQDKVIPDSSVGTRIDSGIITGGTQTSNGTGSQNLFHSFQQFSLAPTDTVTFVVDSAVTNVISRVTGQLPSQIDGTLQMMSSSGANLFLINPAGIVFGPTAQLRLPGSFVATTAESITFANGATFSAQNLETPPPLTVSIPLGLQMGSASQAVSVNNSGHAITKINPTTRETGILAPHVQQRAAGGLQVLPGKTLALIGQGVQFDGGLATANSGNLEIGSIGAGEQVNLVPVPFGLVADYSQVNSFADIDFSNRALANVSGVPVAVSPLSPLQVFATEQGKMQVAGKDIAFSENSLLLGQNGAFSQLDGQPIDVTATGTLSFADSESTTTVRSGIFSETLGTKASGDIRVSAEDISIDSGAAITSLTFTEASSGSINLNAERSLNISHHNPIDSNTGSAIATASVGSTGKSGDITVRAPNLSLIDSGGIVSINFSRGESGNIAVEADTLMLDGRDPISDIPSTISVTNYGPGTVGDVDINTRQLLISGTAAIAALSITSGDAGTININATERVDITGPTETNRRGDAITSSVIRPSIFEQAFLGIPDTRPDGNAGNINIETSLLSINGSFGINAQSDGTGDAGDIRIVADNFRLDNNAEVRGRTFNGSGGNLYIDLQESLIMKNGSRLTVESDGLGDGGNISISVPTLIAVGNSDIVANAIQGQGGNIEIAAQNMLGIAYREQLTSKSDITASSQFGVNGTVAINNPEVDPSSGTVVLPTTVLDPNQTVAASCSQTQQNQFVASGRGGFASDPRARLESLRPWQDLRDSQLSKTVVASALESHSAPETNSIQEAASWQVNREGQIELAAAIASTPARPSLQCLEQNASRG